MDGRVGIRGGNLCLATTSGFFKLRMLSGAKSRHGRGMDTSSRDNIVSRMTSINHRKNLVF